MKYFYHILFLQREKNIEAILNDYGEKGWSVKFISYSDGGNIISVLLEKVA